MREADTGGHTKSDPTDAKRPEQADPQTEGGSRLSGAGQVGGVTIKVTGFVFW